MRPPRPLVIVGLLILSAMSIALALLASVVRATPVAQVDPAPTESVEVTPAPKTEVSLPPTAHIPIATEQSPPVTAEPQPEATRETQPIEIVPVATPNAEPTVVELGAPPVLTATQPVAGGFPIGAAPLSLEMHVANESVAPGGDIQFQLTVRSTSAVAIQTRSFLSGPADVFAVQASGGSCTTGNPVICEWLPGDHAGSATIAVRVSPQAAPGTPISMQTLAQDSLQNTAASSPNSVLVHGGSAEQPSQGDASQADIATPVAPPTGNNQQTQPAPTSALPPPQRAPAPAATPGRPARPTAVTGDTATLEPALAAPLVDPPATSAPAPTAAAVDEPAEPPASAMTTISTAPVTSIEPDSIGKLPETAAFPLAPALSLGLLGCAIIVVGVRRVRAADQEVHARSKSAQHLAAIISSIAYMQRRTRAEAEAMDTNSRNLREWLERRSR